MSEETEVNYNLDGTPIDSNESMQEEPEVTVEEVQELTTSIEMLTDLYYTTSKKGVSKQDIIAFKDICSKMQLSSIDTTLMPALEQYPLGYYTEERSSVNMNYALESFGKTLINAIKAIFQKLVEMARFTVRYIRKLHHGDTLKAKLTNQINAIRKGKSFLKENIALYGTPADLNKRMGDLAIETLSTKFKVNSLLLSFFGGTGKSDIKLVLITSASSIKAVVEVAKALSAIIENKTNATELVIDLAALKRLEHSVKMTVDLTTPPTVQGADLIRQFVYDNSNHTTDNIFEYADLEAIGTYTPVLDYIEGFYLVSDVLEKANKKIQQYNPDDQAVGDEVRLINEYAAMLTQHIGNVKAIMQFIIDYNQLKLKLIGAIYNNDALTASEVFRYARSNVIDGSIDTALNKAHDTFVNIYKVITN